MFKQEKISRIFPSTKFIKNISSLNTWYIGMHESGFFVSGESLAILWYWYNFQFGYEWVICTRYLNSGKFMIDKCKEEKKERKGKILYQTNYLNPKVYENIIKYCDIYENTNKIL